jgi:transcriptional regulator with XRE-family HTH domain
MVVIWLPTKEIGRRVLDIRTGLGVSQKELAARVGRPGSQAEIGRIETGTKEPEANILADIAALAGLTIEHFQEGAPNTERAEKLAAAKWMRRLADELSADALATPPTAPPEDVADEIEESLPDADEGDATQGEAI